MERIPAAASAILQGEGPLSAAFGARDNNNLLGARDDNLSPEGRISVALTAQYRSVPSSSLLLSILELSDTKVYEP